jgi:hypothetical protein
LKRFNILDICVVLALAAAVVLGILYFGVWRGDRDDVWIYYTLEAEGKLKGFHVIVERGDVIKDSLRNYDMGSVHSVRVRESKDWIFNPDTREYIEHFYEHEEVVEVTIRARAAETEDLVRLSSGGGEIRVGKELTLEGKGYSLHGYVIDFYTESRGSN